MSTYYVNKSTNTSADTLLAVGFASFLGDIYRELFGTSEDIFISDMGSYYIIVLPHPLGDVDTVNLSQLTLVLPLDSNKQREKLAKKRQIKKAIDGFDYDKAWEEYRIYHQRIKELPSNLQTADSRLRNAPEILEIPEPDTNTYLNHYQTIKMMIVADSFNELVLRWMSLAEQHKHLYLSILLNLFSNPDNDVEAAIAPWQRFAKDQNMKDDVFVSTLQIINPTRGKGANRAKAGDLTIGNKKNSFWLLELLKFRGFMAASAPLIVKDGQDHKQAEDRKTYVLLPKNIELDTLQNTMRIFRSVLWPSTAIKLDILASLRLAQIFVRQYKVFFERNIALKKWQRQKVVSIAQGFAVTFYKNLGNAYVTMNIADMNLPTWIQLDRKELVEDAEKLLEEHVQLIQHIRNSKGEEGYEEIELLQFYREFISGNDLRPFWKFTTAYSGYLISQREREKNPKRQIRQLTTTGLETFIMNSKNGEMKLTEITSNEGFKHIAYAIRQSTVIAQYRRAQAKDRTYEVRYGLGQELMREARHREKFVTALCEFLQQYNAETAREEEKVANRLGRKLTTADRRANNLRASIAYTDIDEIAALIDHFRSSELICSMLVAYGYAREPRKSIESETLDPQTPDGTQEVIEEPVLSEEQI